MKTQIKQNGLKIKEKTATITLDWCNSKNHYIVKELESLATLLGAYNKYGRKMNYDRFKELQNNFKNIIAEISESL